MRHKFLIREFRCIHYNFRILILILLLLPLRTIGGDNVAFPGAMGWGAETVGGRGGQIIKVTNLNSSGPGSFLEAVNTPGPRIIVFEVGGVIDLNGEQLRISEPYVTIAGQTAPPPGITFIRGGISIRTHDVIIQHIMVRQGMGGISAPGGGIGVRGESGRHAHDIIIDHCSITWGPGNHMSVSGGSDGQVGNTIEERRLNMGHRVTVSNNLIGEGIVDNEGRGSLIHNNVTYVAYLRNLYTKTRDRNPRTNFGVHAVVANNMIYNWTFRPGVFGGGSGDLVEDNKLTWIGNYGQVGPATVAAGSAPAGRPLGYFNSGSGNHYYVYEKDNLHFDIHGNPRPVYGTSSAAQGTIHFLEKIELWHDTIELLPAADVPTYLAANVGARSWDRDPIDQRLVDEAMTLSGAAITHEDQVGGYPNYAPTFRAFNPDEWDLRYMVPLAGYWPAPELISPENNGINVGQSSAFVWNAEDYLTHFTIQIAADEEFSSVIIEETGITGTSYTVGNLGDGTTYYWRVRGHNATGPSKWSEARRFNTDPGNTHTQEIHLKSGWNIISGNVQPDDPAIENIFGSLNVNRLLVRDRTDNLYNPVSDINTIGEWNYDQAYYVFVDESAFLTITGNIIHPESAPIELDEGLNLVPYLRLSPMEVNDALSDIIAKVQLISDKEGNLYWPEYGINTIGQLIPGVGYIIYLSESAAFSYPPNE